MKLTFDVPEELAEKIAEDIKVAIEEHKKDQMWPQKGDHYYYVSSNGFTYQDTYDDDYNAYDKGRLSLGNYFKTEEEAEFKIEQLKVLHELEQLADDDQLWNNSNLHYTFCYKHSIDKIIAEHWSSFQCLLNTYYFKSFESAQAAIDKIGKDRLKKYYFCIPE